MTKALRLPRTALTFVSMLFVMPSFSQTTGTLSITSPNSGTVVSPGQSLTVNVAASPAGNFTSGVSLVGQNPTGVVASLPSSPYSFQITIPAGISPGSYSITAFANASGSLVSSPPVQLQVERTDQPTSLQLEPNNLSFRFSGEQIPLLLYGTFSSGTQIVTASSLVTFQSSTPSVATVSTTGIVTAVTSGTSTITASYGSIQATLKVSVPASSRGDLNADGVVNMDDYNLLSDFVGTNAVGAFDSRDLNSDGVINSNDQDILISLCGSACAATANPTPTSLQFAGQTVGSVSSSQAVTVQNTGATALAISGIGVSGADAGDFGESSNCGSSLAAESSCAISVTFNPTGGQTRTGTLVLNDNASGSPQTVALTGVGIVPAKPVITWATPAAITYGTALSGLQLDAGASVPGQFVYSPAAGTLLPAGTDTISLTFTPTDTIDYSSATTSVQVVVNKATPMITWANPAPIVDGTALSATQLDASASVPGTFVYSPAAGAIPSAGADALNVTFTPTDTTDYKTATATATLTVNLPPGFNINSSTVSISIPGATIGNTSTITVTPIGGFTGTVTLAASVTASPIGAQDLPTFSFSPGSTINITGASAVTSTLTISTTAATAGDLTIPKRPGTGWTSIGGTTLACLLLFVIPVRPRRSRTMLGLLVLFAVFTGGVVGCGGGGSSSSGTTGNPGTTAGNYTITVTATSGSLSAVGTVVVTVQ